MKKYALALAAFAVPSLVAPLVAGSVCDPGTGPDLIVAEIDGITRWGTVDGVTAYSIGTTACNCGDEEVPWIAATCDHPVIGQELYRFKGNRFEQIGMSWVKHGFFAAPGVFCGTCRDPGSSSSLGVGCSDTYVSILNGDQDGAFSFGGLGPRSEVNPATGAFPYPYSTQGTSGDDVYKRLQVHNDDLEPALNGGAVYYGEGHYVSAQDAAAGNKGNNVSHRPIAVGAFAEGGFDLSFTGLTEIAKPAIEAWRVHDPGVELREIEVPDDGLLVLGARCSDNGDGTWHYEYALYNMNSDRSGGSFSIPLPPSAAVSGIGFHDVDYHSGEPYDGTDWPGAVAGGAIAWATATFADNADANALRWGTLYNFRFDADAAPGTVTATIGLFKPGAPDAMDVLICGPGADPCPADLDGSGIVGFSDLTDLLAAWGPCAGCPEDLDPNGVVGFADLTALLAAWGPCL